MSRVTLPLPKIVIDTHCHGRGRKESYKTTPYQVLQEARDAGIAISFLMPNTDDPIISLESLHAYSHEISFACKQLELKRKQGLYFGATDDNLGDCAEALDEDLDVDVVGIKAYPKKKGGVSVTTGKNIGVSRISTIVKLLELSADTGKPVAFHCEDPLGIHEPEDEIRFIKLIIDLARDVKRWYGNPKIVICHATITTGIGLVIQAWEEGLEIALEFAPHHLFFSSNTAFGRRLLLDPKYYDCYPPIREEIERNCLDRFIWKPNRLVFCGSDSAYHTSEEKLRGLRGIPSNQELIAVIATSAYWQRSIPPDRIAELLSWNAADFFGLDVPHETVAVEFEEREDDCIYNNGVVTNPWMGQKLFFPVRNEKETP